MGLFDTINPNAKEKKGAFCDPMCREPESACEACLAWQNDFSAKLDGVKELEYRINQVNKGETPPSKKIVTKCALCGAPAEKGAKACPYCDTPYDGSTDDSEEPEIPTNGYEQKQLLLKKCTEAYGMYYAHFVGDVSYKERAKNMNIKGLGGTLFSVFAGAMDVMKQNYNLTEQQFAAGADYYNIGYVDYMLGLIEHKYKDIVTIKDEEAQKAAHEAQLGAIQQKGKADREYWQRKAASYVTPQYNGGYAKSTCCGTCSYYLVQEKRCLYFAGTSGEYRSGPNDYCNNYRS